MKRFLLGLLVLACTSLTAQAQGGFGSSMAVIDGTVLIGQPRTDSGAGAVLVFRASEEGDGWVATDTLRASDASDGDGFGLALVRDGSQLAVGAPGHVDGQGAVYVFEQDSLSGAWMETSLLTVADADSTTKIGGAVAISGARVVVGAPTQNESSGAVYYFHKVQEEWQAPIKIEASEMTPGAFFGWSVAMSGDHVVVGAPGRDDSKGAVVVFKADAATDSQDIRVSDNSEDGVAVVKANVATDQITFQEVQTLTNNAADAKALGLSLHVLENGTIVSGAPGIVPSVPPTGPPPAGVLLTFARGDDGQWSEATSIMADSSAAMNLFGYTMSSDDGMVLVGEPGANGFQGAVHVYSLDDTTGAWTVAHTLAAGSDDQAFGVALAINDGTVAVSAPGSSSGEGAVTVVSLMTESGMPQMEVRLTPFGEAIELDLSASGPVECAEGVALHFDCSDVDLLSFLPIADLGGDESVNLNDIWGWTDPDTDREYALVGRTNGTSFVDVTDPDNPVFLGDLPMTEGATANSWRDIKVYDSHAFVVADNAGQHGMQVFDLRQLRDVSAPPVTFEEATIYDKIASAHNIVINEATGFAFAVGSSGGGETCGGGLHVIDIREPTSPTFVGCFADTETGRSGTGYTHDAQCVIYNRPDTEHLGKEVCFNSNETALSIADVTDKENPLALSNASYPNVSYAHQGWLTEDHAHFYMNDELDELQGNASHTRTLIWDVSDLDDPQLLKEMLSENTSSDHNLYIRDNLMYQSNYRSGLRILDVSDVENPVEVGYFDTEPGGPDRAGFEGSWSNYPFFKSGTIIVSSIGEGLFVLKKRGVDT